MGLLMSLLALALLLVSAILHAGWNFVGKTRTPTASFFLVANVSGFVLLSPLLFLHTDMMRSWPGTIWWLLVLTGFFQATYSTSLAAAYRSGDISVAYPMARSSPILVVMATTLLLGRGEQLSAWCAVGAGLIVAGCFMIPMRRFTDLRWENYRNTSCLFALLAAVGTAGYSIVDDETLRFLRNISDWNASLVERSLLFACWQALSSTCWLLLLIVSRPVGRNSLRKVLKHDHWIAVAAGVAIYVTYGLVLVSMAFAQNVSYIVAFRQISIPIGVGLGVMFLGESLSGPKVLGVLVLLVGLLFVAMG
jgi:drug/metabolite transporter (DMT)-like permease